jgi:hypothetical protein
MARSNPTAIDNDVWLLLAASARRASALRARGKNIPREMTQRNGKLPLIRFDGGSAYEGEWLNGKLHGHGIYTWANKNR